jgi:cytochrome c peroxidase
MDLSEVRDELCALMFDRAHDDGSYAPLLIRFAWHCCGTWDHASRTGGSNGGTMRFPAEQADPENAGLGKARALLAPIVEKYASQLSTADVWILAGYVALDCTGGPCLRFRTGRRDYTESEAEALYGGKRCPFGDGIHNPHGSRLPAADLGRCPVAGSLADSTPSTREAATIDAVRGTFRRLGLTDKETVCLILLGHQFGRAHPEYSGYEGPWYVNSPATWNSDGEGTTTRGMGFLDVFSKHWSKYVPVTPVTRASNPDAAADTDCQQPPGLRQYQLDYMGAKWTALVSDMALVWDEAYREHLEFYAAHREAFKADAARSWIKLTELGCPESQLQSEVTDLGEDEIVL